MTAVKFHALATATTRDEMARVPFTFKRCQVGSVARRHLPLLAPHTELLHVQPHTVRWIGPEGGPAGDAAFARLNQHLRAQGHIVAWRDEIYPVLEPTSSPVAPRVLGHIERAASRFWGTLTFGAHATGYLAGPGGRPTHLWLGQRSLSKAIDPGLFDNLIGGGVAAGQTPAEALLREAWEEAGLRPEQMHGLRAAGVLRLARDIPEGFQHEWLHSFDLELPAGQVPHNQDGEVAGFTLLPVAQALALAAGTQMTVDAALVTIDFALRHGLLDEPAVARRMQTLRDIRAG